MSQPLRVTPGLIAFYARRAHDLRSAEIHARLAGLWRLVTRRGGQSRRCVETF